MKEFNEFKKLKFHSVIPQDILQAVSLLEKLGYEAVRNDFSADDAAKHNGLCAWDDGEITEGWLDTYSGFKQVTVEELKEMVGETEEVLWLNKNTLEEKYLKDGNKIRGIDWVIVPEGATFATGDKDSFVFRKDGWYYDNQKCEWVKGDVTIQNLHTHEFVKLFWVKSDVKDSMFTLERLLGCEVAYKGVNYWVTSIYNISKGKHLILYNGTHLVYMPDLKLLTFFTEDGDEVAFDEYVSIYYGCEDYV